MAERSDSLEKEYKRWKDYASVLLLALTVLFAGPVIGGYKTLYSILSVGFGVAGIILVVMWHAREYKIQFNKKPAFLLGASCSLGAQAVFLLFQVILP
jgi:hypothetical protein